MTVATHTKCSAAAKHTAITQPEKSPSAPKYHQLVWCSATGVVGEQKPMKAKQTKKAVTPALSPLERYNLQRAQEAQTAHGGKPVQALSTRTRYNEHRESRYIY